MTNSNTPKRRRVQHPKVDGFGQQNQTPKLEYPTLSQQAKNLALTARQVARNPKIASSDLYEQRMEICRACDFFDQQQVRCRKCGCRLKGKAKFEGAKCPIQKW